MVACGAISLIALIAAIFLPVMKKEAGILSAITGGIALLVPFLEPIHLNIIYGLGLAYLAFVIVRKQLKSNKEDELKTKINNNLINAIQDIKETKPDIFKEIAPVIAERNTVYTDGNNKVQDQAVVEHIDAVLRDYERK